VGCEKPGKPGKIWVENEGVEKQGKGLPVTDDKDK